MRPWFTLLAAATLYANISTESCAGRTYKIPCDKVEMALNELAKTSLREDAWICRGDVLYDVGRLDRKDARKAEFSGLEKHLRKGGATIYHIHPVHLQDGRGPHPPSAADIIGSHERRKQDSKLIEKVLDGRGMWTYSTSEEFDKKMQYKDDLDALFGSVFFSGHLIELRNSILANKPLTEEVINLYISEMLKLGIIVSYKSLE